MKIVRAKNSGFCFGVKRAIDDTYKSLSECSEKIYSIGPIIHNEIVTQDLKAKGLIELNDYAEIMKLKSAKVIVRTHGIEKNILETLKSNGNFIIDLTCPFVKKIHSLVDEYSGNGYKVIVIGDKNHPEVKGIVSYSRGPIYVIISENEIKDLDIDKNDKVLIVFQTTTNASNAEKLVDILRNLFYNNKLVNTICNATENRQEEVTTLSKTCDVMLIIGSKTSSNTKKLYEISKQHCSNTYILSNKSDFLNINIKSDAKVGVSAGASTPEYLIEEIVKMAEMSFEELLNESMKEIHTGEIVTGRVISVHKDYAALNIGYKADGIIKSADYSRDPYLDLTTVLHPGDELTVKVKKLNDGEGQVVLSRRELMQGQINEKLKALYESNEVQHGKVTKITAGGVIVEIEPDVVVFIPKSLLTNKANEDINSYEGKELEFVISEFNPAKNRCIGDRKKLLVMADKKKREEALTKIKENDVIEGTIINLLDYGAFVDIGGVDGLLHISEMGWGKIKNPKKTFSIGDKIKVLVREIKDGKISLTAKFPDENPWLLARVNYALGKTIKGKVVRMTDYGAFVALDDYIDALLHISEISRDKIKKPEDVLKIGQEIEAKVIDYNEVDKRISLSIKALLPEPEAKKEADNDIADINIEEYAKKMEEENK